MSFCCRVVTSVAADGAAYYREQMTHPARRLRFFDWLIVAAVVAAGAAWLWSKSDTNVAAGTGASTSMTPEEVEAFLQTHNVNELDIRFTIDSP